MLEWQVREDFKWATEFPEVHLTGIWRNRWWTVLKRNFVYQFSDVIQKRSSSVVVLEVNSVCANSGMPMERRTFERSATGFLMDKLPTMQVF
jgi:hypothetical protein